MIPSSGPLRLSLVLVIVAVAAVPAAFLGGAVLPSHAAAWERPSTGADRSVGTAGDAAKATATRHPNAVDSDGDGLTDVTEVRTTGTDPLDADSDGDHVGDTQELSLRSDPTNAFSPLSNVGVVAAGFVAGTMLSNRFALVQARIGRGLESVPVVGGAIGALRTDAVEASSDSGGDTEDTASVGAEETASVDAGETASVDAGETASVDDEQARPEISDEQLVPDVVRVRELLAENDGRLSQSEVVEATTWSKSKVSRLLSRMAENGSVVKVPMGRENLICLPGREPEVARRNAAD